MATLLSAMTQGSLVKLNENGSPVEFYVAKHNYESGLNGAGRTLVVRKDCYDTRAWHSSNVNAYASSAIDTWLNGTYKALLDADIQAAIGTTKFYYTPGNGNTTDSQLERAVFALSLKELGKTASSANTEGSALPIASTLQIAYRNGSAVVQWTRSPYTYNTYNAWNLGTNGNIYNDNCTNTYGARPAFTLPSTMEVLDDGQINLPPEDVTSITVPDFATQGGSVPVSWAAAEDPNGDIAGYLLQRSVNGGTWTAVYNGAALTYTDTAPDTATRLQYRVSPYDSAGQFSAGALASSVVPVYGNPALTVPPTVMQGQPCAVSWTAVTGADSYILQRKSSADTDWTQVYAGTDLTFTETAGEWTSLQYQVCAVFGEGTGPFVGSGEIQIIAASALDVAGPASGLGTITNDVQYSILSDQADITPHVVIMVRYPSATSYGEEQIADFNAVIGQTYAVSILDLPSGTGNISITAEATISGAPVSVTKSWTYTKATHSFPGAGSVASLSQEGKTVWPQTLAEAVRTAGGAPLDKVLVQLLSRRVSNRNLLDNWYLVNPINQRDGRYAPAGTRYYSEVGCVTLVGTLETDTVAYNASISRTSNCFITVDGTKYYVTYGSTISGYCTPLGSAGDVQTYDRYLLANGYTTQTENGVNIRPTGSQPVSITQRFETSRVIFGRTYTFSVLTTEGVYSHTAVLNPSTSISSYKDFGRMSFVIASTVSGVSSVAIHANTDITIIAFKLEQGAEQTLAIQDENGAWVLNDPPPNYQQELAKCQRYQVELAQAALVTNVEFGYANITSSSRADATIPIPVPLRTTPTISKRGELFVITSDASKSKYVISSIGNHPSGAQSITMLLTIEGGGATLGPAMLMLGSGVNDGVSLFLDASL